ncbi:hydrogenase maturation nickel metallochaperone HypA [Persephonella sp.]
MHEFSVVQSLLHLIEENVYKNNGKYVTKVVLKIGKLSGIEPDLLRTAFDTFKEKTVCEKAELIIIHQDVIAVCEECGSKFQVKDFHFVCKKCGSLNIDVVDGKDMLLMQIEMEV